MLCRVHWSPIPDHGIKDEAEKKQQNRSEYGIGWTAQQVPRNALTAARLILGLQSLTW